MTKASTYSDFVPVPPTLQGGTSATNTFVDENLASAFSHKLRNYLAAVISGTEQLAEIVPTVPGSESETLLELITRAGQEQMILIDRFVQAFGPIRLSARSTDVCSLLEHCVEQCNPDHLYSIDFQADNNDLNISTDQTIMMRAVTELLTNALEARVGKAVRLRFHESGTKLRIEVSNSGCLAPETNLDDLSKPFYSTKPSHSGLGLSIGRRCAQALGGVLELTTASGETTFSLTIPKENFDLINKPTERKS